MTLLKRCICFLFCLTPQSLFAEEGGSKQIAACAALKSNVKRLECFDETAQKLGLNQPETKSDVVGKWQVNTDISKIDDSKQVFLFLEADQPVRTGYKSGHPELIIRCSESKTSLYINYGFFLGSDDTDVLYRIDKEKAQTRNWNISTDHNAVGLWNGGTSIPFIKSLLERSDLYFQVTPYGESPVNVNFTLVGINEALKPLREACKW